MSEIIRTPEDVGATGTGTIDGDYLSHSISGPLSDPSLGPFSVSAGGSSVTVTYIPDPTLFPLQYVEYVDPSGEVIRIDGNDALSRIPESAEHISKMREDFKDLLRWTLTVQGQKVIPPPPPDPGAEPDPDAPPPAPTIIPVSGSFIITILANYNPSKGLLLSEVAARS